MPKKKKESLKYKIVLKKMHNDTNFQDEELFNVELLVGGEDVVVYLTSLPLSYKKVTRKE